MIKFWIWEQNKDRMRKNKRTKRSTIRYLPATSSIRSHFPSHHPFSFTITPSFLTFYHTILSHFPSHHPFSFTITVSFLTFYHTILSHLLSQYPFSFTITPSFLTFYHTILSHLLSHHPFILSITGTSLTWFGINPVLLFESQAFNSCFVINILSSLLRAGWTATIRPQLSNHGPSIELERENKKMRKWVNRVVFIQSANMGTLRSKVLDTKFRIQEPRSIISSMIKRKYQHYKLKEENEHEEKEGRGKSRTATTVLFR